MALLKFKRSAVPAKVPSIADLALGELAINTYDGKVYTKKDDGTPAIVQVGGGGGVQTITSSDGSVTVTGTTDINLSVPVTAATNTVLLPVRNNTGATLAKGTAVYINGALGQNPTVTKAIATGDATSAQTLGLVTANISNNAVGNVTLIGSLTNLDTSAYTDGAQLYLSPTTAGALTATKPYAPNHLVYMAVVEHAHPSLGKLFVKVQNGYEMDELHNVAAQSPANNDGLFYNTTTSLWEKKSIATALGYTPANKAGDAFTGGVYSAGQIRAAGWWGDVSASATGLGVEIGESGNRGYVISYSRDTAAYGPMSFEATDFTFTGVSGGYIGVNTSVRAPIFYDSNNTAYYMDLTSSTSINAGGSILASGNLTLNNGANRYVRIGSATNYSYDLQTTGDDFQIIEAGTTPRLTIKYPNGFVGIGTASPLANVHVVGAAMSTGVNPPAGTQILSHAGGFDAGTFGASLNFTQQWFSGAPTSLISVGQIVGLKTAGNGNFGGGLAFFVGPSGAGSSTLLEAMRIDGNAGGAVTANVNMRAPIFYDSNDTGYYLDAASTSVLTTVYARKTAANNTPAIQIRGGNAGYPRLQTYGLDADASAWMGLGTDMGGGPYEHSVYFPNGAGAGRLSIGDYNGTTYNPRLWVYTSYTQINNSTRSPLFYDSDNTGYFLDPAGNSNLVSVQINGTLNVLNSNAQFWGSTNGAYQRVDTRTEATSLSRAHWYGVSNTGGTSNFRHAWYDNAAYFNVTAQDGEIIFERTAGNAIVRSTGSFRAPAFYDSNDTAYYIDPNGNSTVNNLYAGGGLFVLYNSVGDKVDGSPWYGMGGTTSGTVQVAGYYGLRLRTASSIVDLVSDYAQANNSFRAPIFYDSNNTGYYVDPASTSNLNALNLVSGSVLGAAVTFNNMNQAHGAYGDANLVGDFGFRYLQGGTNGPGISGASQYYGMTLGLGNNFDFGSYASQFYWPRAAIGGLAYPSIRFKENGTWSAWSKIYAGWADAPSGSTFAATGDFRAPVFYDSNDTAYYLDASSTATSLNVAGNIVAAGNVTAYSDIRVKANVETIPSALNKLDQIRGVTYTRTDLDDKEQRYAGVIAQEIEAVLPEAVRDLGNIKAVDYNATIALLIQAVKELRDEVETLKK